MKRVFILALACLLASFPASAQRGAGGGGQGPKGITYGADQPNQNKWNAVGPWGKTERSAPLEAQRKDPFKLSIERTGKIKGAVVETGTWKLSPDGKTLTVTTKGKIDAQEYSNTQVFERLED